MAKPRRLSKSKIGICYSYAVTGSDSFSWNPSLENFKRLLGDKLVVMTQTLEQLAQGRVKLLQLADSGKRMGARRLSFANKLSVLTGRQHNFS
ncbi:hypothetical protein [Rheinheimera sp.]|uniref:hypothetical protein n=1 Tax=Rheinheimera sp. TaxID=1869214 RepID=UPI00404750B7